MNDIKLMLIWSIVIVASMTFLSSTQIVIADDFLTDTSWQDSCEEGYAGVNFFKRSEYHFSTFVGDDERGTYVVEGSQVKFYIDGVRTGMTGRVNGNKLRLEYRTVGGDTMDVVFNKCPSKPSSVSSTRWMLSPTRMRKL